MQKSTMMTEIKNLITTLKVKEEVDLIFTKHGYNWKIRKYVEIQKTILMQMAIYLVARQHFNELEGVNNSFIAGLQLAIKHFFVVSSIGEYQFSTEPYFLEKLAINAQLLSQILEKVILPIATGQSPTEIFITIVFVATDKLLSERCYVTILQRIKAKSTLKLTSNRKKKTQGPLKESLQIIRKPDHLSEFQKELKENLYPKTPLKVEMKIKETIICNNTVLFAKSRFTHKGRKTYYESGKTFNGKVLNVDTFKIARSYSEGSTKTKTPASQTKKLSIDKGNVWSKFQMLNSYYPFDNRTANLTPSKGEKQRINWSEKLSQLKQKQKLIIKQQPNRLTRECQ